VGANVGAKEVGVGAAVGTVGAIDVVRGEHHHPNVSHTHIALLVHVVWSEIAEH
jgi:hypothetical protein